MNDIVSTNPDTSCMRNSSCNYVSNGLNNSMFYNSTDVIKANCQRPFFCADLKSKNFDHQMNSFHHHNQTRPGQYDRQFHRKMGKVNNKRKISRGGKFNTAVVNALQPMQSTGIISVNQQTANGMINNNSSVITGALSPSNHPHSGQTNGSPNLAASPPNLMNQSLNQSATGNLMSITPQLSQNNQVMPLTNQSIQSQTQNSSNHPLNHQLQSNSQHPLLDLQMNTLTNNCSDLSNNPTLSMISNSLFGTSNVANVANSQCRLNNLNADLNNALQPQHSNKCARLDRNNELNWSDLKPANMIKLENDLNASSPNNHSHNSSSSLESPVNCLLKSDLNVKLTGGYSAKSRNGKYELKILKQPEEQHRARYLTEGSRGSIKDQDGLGHPVVKLFGFNEAPIRLQCFIGHDKQIGVPHLFYQASKITGKNSTRCTTCKIDGTTVINMELLPEYDMTATIDCIGILKERNVDVEQKVSKMKSPINSNVLDASKIVQNQSSNASQSANKLPLESASHSTSNFTQKKRSTRCRLVFRCKIPETNEILQVISSPILCTQPPGTPEICKMSQSECDMKGGKELFIIGKNFLKDTKIIMKADGWTKICEPDKEYLHNTHLVCNIPPYDGPIMHSKSFIKVMISVRSGGKCSEFQQFHYIDKMRLEAGNELRFDQHLENTPLNNFNANGSTCKNSLNVCKVANTCAQSAITSNQIHQQSSSLSNNQASLIANHPKSNQISSSSTHQLMNTNLCTESQINQNNALNNQQLFNNFGSPTNNVLRSPQTNSNNSPTNLNPTVQRTNTNLSSPITSTNTNHLSDRLNMNLPTSLALSGKSQSSSNVLHGVHCNSNNKKPHTAKHFLNRANSMDFQHRISAYRFSEDSMISNDDSMMSDYMYPEDSYMPMTSTVSASILDTNSQHDITHSFRQIKVHCSFEQEQGKQNKSKLVNQQVNSGSNSALNNTTTLNTSDNSTSNAIGNAISNAISKQISNEISNNCNFSNMLNNQLSNQVNHQINGPINDAVNNTLNVSSMTSTPLTTTQILNAAKRSIDLDSVVANTTCIIQQQQHQMPNPIQSPTPTTVQQALNESINNQLTNDSLTQSVQKAVVKTVASPEIQIKLENVIKQTAQEQQQTPPQSNQPSVMFTTIPEEKNEIINPTSQAQSISNYMTENNSSDSHMLPPVPVIAKSEPMNIIQSNNSPGSTSDMMSLANVEQLVQNTIGMTSNINNTINYMNSQMTNGSNMLISRAQSSPEHAFISQNSQSDMRMIRQQSPQLIQSPPLMMQQQSSICSQNSQCIGSPQQSQQTINNCGQIMDTSSFNLQQTPQTSRSNSIYDEMNIKKELSCTVSNMMANDNIIQSRMTPMNESQQMQSNNNGSPPHMMRNLSVNNLIMSDENNNRNGSPSQVIVSSVDNSIVNSSMISAENMNNLTGSLSNSLSNNNMNNMNTILPNMMQNQMNIPQPMDTQSQQQTFNVVGEMVIDQPQMKDQSQVSNQSQQNLHYQQSQSQQQQLQQMIINDLVQNSGSPNLDQNSIVGGNEMNNQMNQMQQSIQQQQSQNLQVQNQSEINQANNSPLRNSNGGQQQSSQEIQMNQINNQMSNQMNNQMNNQMSNQMNNQMSGNHMNNQMSNQMNNQMNGNHMNQNINHDLSSNPSTTQSSHISAMSQMSDNELLHMINPQTFNEGVYFC